MMAMLMGIAGRVRLRRRMALAIGACVTIVVAAWLVAIGVESDRQLEDIRRPTDALEDERILGQERHDVTLAPLDGSYKIAARHPAVLGDSSFGERPGKGAGWAHGSVEFPAGTPDDELVHLFVTPVWRRGNLMFPVATDGTFRVPLDEVPHGTPLTIRSRLLFLESPVVLGSPEAGPLVLRPQLGGRIQGRFSLSPGLGEDDTRQLRVRLATTHTSSLSGRPMLAFDETEPDASRTFEFLSVPAPAEAFISAYGSQCEPVSVSAIQVVPGETTEVSVELALGGAIAGTVLNTSDVPVLGARIELELEGMKPVVTLTDQTDQNGVFSFAGLPVESELKLSARSRGYASKTISVSELARGESRRGLRVVLDTGNVIAGFVQWADGSPATLARVEALRDTKRHAEAIARSDREGYFSVSGLGASRYMVRAVNDPKGDDGTKEKFLAVEAGVQVGTTDLVLTLKRAERLGGYVLDDMGRAVTGFRMRVVQLRENLKFPATESGRVRFVPFQSADGSFEISGLSSGLYRVDVSSPDHQSATVDVRTSDASVDSLRIVLLRTAHVRGRAVDGAGNPVFGAWMQWEPDDSASRFERAMYGTSTKPDGGFDLPVPVERGRVVARHSSFAPSASRTLEPAPGSAVDGLRIVLGGGGTIDGVVLGLDGEPSGSVEVRAIGGEVVEVRRATTGSDGAYRFERLPPGDYRLRASASARDAAFAGRWGLEPGKAMESALARAVCVAVREGATVRGDITHELVLVSGRVMPHGAEYHSWIHARCLEPVEVSRGSRIRKDGGFDVLVRPGLVEFKSHNDVVLRHIPAGSPRFHLDLEFTGRLQSPSPRESEPWGVEFDRAMEAAKDADRH